MSGVDLSNGIRHPSDTVKIILVTSFDLVDLKDLQYKSRQKLIWLSKSH